jgi:hypothetical protein
MNLKVINAEDLRNGMLLYDWTPEARKQQGGFRDLQQRPSGCWNAMVIANNVQEPREIDGFGYPPVHRVDVFFWNKEGHVRFESFFWTVGTTSRVIET